MAPNGTARLRGRAAFTAEGDGWRYREIGQLTIVSGQTLAAERSYVYRAVPDGADVWFTDGRPFHSFRWADGRTEHACPPDTYRGAYAFGAWPRWRLVWWVRGPAKRLTIVSRYRRP